MADNKQWFKVWTSMLTDPNLSSLHNQTVGCWLRLCALTAQHGTDGKLTIPQHQLLVTLHISTAPQNEIDQILNELKTLNISMDEEVQKGCVTLVTLQIVNWAKYQAYSESFERVRKFRKLEKERYTCNVEKKRREEKRREEKRKEENKKRKESKREGSQRFLPPTLEEIKAYCLERKNQVNPEKWLSHYQTKGWMVGNTKMVDWRAGVRTWEEPKRIWED